MILDGKKLPFDCRRYADLLICPHCDIKDVCEDYNAMCTPRENNKKLEDKRLP